MEHLELIGVQVGILQQGIRQKEQADREVAEDRAKLKALKDRLKFD